MPLELEVKMRINDRSAVDRMLADADLSTYISGTPRDIQMRSRYYDTPDSELSSRKWSLRLRDEGGMSVASFKNAGVFLAESVLSRSEFQVLTDDINAAIPLLIAEGAPAELAELTAGKPLVERCYIEFLRKSAILKLPDGLVVDLCIDVGEITADGKTEPICELELELLFGRAEDLAPLCDILTSRYPLERELLSKYERALRLIRSRPSGR